MFFLRRRRRVRRRSGAGCLLAVVLLILLIFVVLRALRAQAQEPVTYDEVNAVAERMYCPECENIPLDKCFSPVCVQWKQDIAEQLAAGRGEDEIIDDFVARFGDQVVGVPQDSSLRTLTLAAPWILALIVGLLGAYTLYRLRFTQPSRGAEIMALSDGDDTPLDEYRERIERDLNESR